jgi:hypothetical protein
MASLTGHVFIRRLIANTMAIHRPAWASRSIQESVNAIL